MSRYQAASGNEPPRTQIDQSRGDLVLEFGAGWCPHCQGVQPALKQELDAHGSIAHIKVEDGKGKPLGRSFGVKLWPTLVFLRDGAEVKRLVRPGETELRQAFEEFSTK